MADAFHRRPLKHQARRAGLFALSHLPFIPRRTDSQRILVIRPDHLGDVLLTSPAIRALHAAYPTAEIHALVGPWSSQVLANFDEVSRILTVPFPGFSRTPKKNWRSPYQQAFTTASQLRRIGYSAAFIMRPDHWWGALVARLAGISRRVGYDVEDTKPFLTEHVPLKHEHALLQSIHLVDAHLQQAQEEHPPLLSFPIREDDRHWVSGYLEEWGVPRSRQMVAIHPGSGTWAKRWDEARWSQVADVLHDQLEIDIIFTGGDHELPMIRQIANRMHYRPIVMGGDTTIGQLAALYERCAAVLGPDSGPLHLAAAVGTPTVSLFGPADPVEFAPWGPVERHLVLMSNIGCRPCRVIDWGTDDPANHPCLRDITLERVLEAARRVIQHDRF